MLSFLLINSCSDLLYDDIKCDCNIESINTTLIIEPSDSLENTYYEIWRNNFISKNNWDEDDFNEHIYVTNIDLHDWNSGTSFRVDYYYIIDWANIKHHDKFIVRLYSEESAYQYLNIPRDTYLNESWVIFCVNKNVFSSTITQLQPIKGLRYSSCQEACVALNKSNGFQTITNVELSLHVPGNIPRVDGYPYMLGSGVINYDENICVHGHINLANGESIAQETACWVNK